MDELLGGIGALPQIESIDLPDGGVELIDITAEIPVPVGHDDNLALHMDAQELTNIGMSLSDAIGRDEKSREPWLFALLKGLDLLGLRIDERDYPFPGACGLTDSAMLDSLVRTHAQVYGELFPAAGPVDTKIYGESTPDKLDRARRVKEFFNLYLCEIQDDYIEDSDQMLMWAIMAGSVVRKVYLDMETMQPTARFIQPDKFVVSADTASLDQCRRMTMMSDMSERQVLAAMKAGQFLEVDMGQGIMAGSDSFAASMSGVTGIVPDSTYDKMDTLYRICETSLYARFDSADAGVGGNLPLPYRVYMDKETKRILGVYRDWREGDTEFKRKRQYAHYKYMQGFGFYGMGYAQLFGNRAAGRTTILRQYIDSASFASFPGGVKKKGIRDSNNNFRLAPGEFREVDTGGDTLPNSFMPLPFKEPSPAMFDTYRYIGEEMKQLASGVDVAIGAGSQNAPVGTTLALMDAAMKPMTAAMKRLHAALKKELGIFYDLFGETLAKPFEFEMDGARGVVSADDFARDLRVVPASDPNMKTSAHRMVLAEQMVRVVQGIQPNIQPYQREALKMAFEQFGIDKPDRFLPPPPAEVVPLDPLTENERITRGEPVKAGIEQDHDSHIEVHMMVAESPQAQAHIAEHIAMKMRLDIEAQIGQPLPTGNLPMRVQNEIAVMVAQVASGMRQAAEQNAPIDPMVVALKELEVRTEELRSRERQAAMKIQAQMAQAQLASQDKAADRAVDIESVKVKALTQIMTDNSTAGGDVPEVLKDML